MRDEQKPAPESDPKTPPTEPAPADGGTENGNGSAPEDLPEAIAAELDDLRKKAEERDQFLALAQRVQADFANYQKRVAGEKEQWSKFLHADFLRDLLPALDALDACATMAAKGGDPQAHLEGYRIALKELARILEKNGLSLIAPDGGEFDPAVHDAIGIVQTDDRPENSVAELVRKGYRLHERILRPAQVLVAKKPAETDAPKNTPE
jgi:molecular chaperone GrpE